MGKSFRLDDTAWKKITGLYQLEKGMAEIKKEDDLLILKMNGQYMETMVYKGNNMPYNRTALFINHIPKSFDPSKMKDR